MRWHFNLFDMDSGRRATPFQRSLYRFVNSTIPNVFGLILGMLVMVSFIGVVYVIIHFILKYW